MMIPSRLHLPTMPSTPLAQRPIQPSLTTSTCAAPDSFVRGTKRRLQEEQSSDRAEQRKPVWTAGSGKSHWSRPSSPRQQLVTSLDGPSENFWDALGSFRNQPFAMPAPAFVVPRAPHPQAQVQLRLRAVVPGSLEPRWRTIGTAHRMNVWLRTLNRVDLSLLPFPLTGLRDQQRTQVVEGFLASRRIRLGPKVSIGDVVASLQRRNDELRRSAPAVISDNDPLP